MTLQSLLLILYIVALFLPALLCGIRSCTWSAPLETVEPVLPVKVSIVLLLLQLTSIGLNDHTPCTLILLLVPLLLLSV